MNITIQISDVPIYNWCVNNKNKFSIHTGRENLTWTLPVCSTVYSPWIHLLPWSPCLIHCDFPRENPCLLYRRNTSTWGPYMWYQKETQCMDLVPLPAIVGLMICAVSLGSLGDDVSMYTYQPCPIKKMEIVQQWPGHLALSLPLIVSVARIKNEITKYLTIVAVF